VLRAQAHQPLIPTLAAALLLPTRALSSQFLLTCQAAPRLRPGCWPAGPEASGWPTGVKSWRPAWVCMQRG
jgi:hypothetical protein